MEKLVARLVATIYRRVFNAEMSSAEGDFLRSLSWVGGGTLVSTALLGLFSIIGGRLLGPGEYGKFTLIQSVAMFLQIPMLMGFNVAMLKYGSENAEPERQRQIVSTAHIIIAGLSAVWAALMIVFAETLAGLFAITPELFRFAVYFALLYAFFLLTQTTLRSVGRMRAFALSHPARAVALLGAFALLVLLQGPALETMLYSSFIAFGATGLSVYILYIGRHITFRLNTTWVRALTRYALAYVIAIISLVVCDEIGKVVVARYMTVADVGIYGAYFIATMSTANLLWQVFNMVFFPTASRYRDKRPILRRINRLAVLTIVFGIPPVMGAGYVILLLYGGGYPLSIIWLALLSSAAVLFVIRGFYASLLASAGPRGAFISSVSGLMSALVILGLSVFLVPIVGIGGAMAAAVAGYGVGILVLLWRGRRYLGQHSDKMGDR